MKKIVLFFGALVVAVITTVATQANEQPSGCGVTQCGGGETKCCSQEGATYYLTRPA